VVIADLSDIWLGLEVSSPAKRAWRNRDMFAGFVLGRVLVKASAGATKTILFRKKEEAARSR
jgi:hypothetical protein